MVPVQWAAVASCSGLFHGSGSSSELGVKGSRLGVGIEVLSLQSDRLQSHGISVAVGMCRAL